MYWKSIADDSVFVCDKIINLKNSVSTNEINTISINITSTVPANSNDKEVWYKINCFFLHYYFYLWSPIFAIIMQNIGKTKKNIDTKINMKTKIHNDHKTFR